MILIGYRTVFEDASWETSGRHTPLKAFVSASPTLEKPYAQVKCMYKLAETHKNHNALRSRVNTRKS